MPQEGPPDREGGDRVRIIGDDLEVLERPRLGRFRTIIRNVPGLVNLDDDMNRGKPELRVKVDRERGDAIAGVNTQDDCEHGANRDAWGVEASKYRIGEDEYDIVGPAGRPRREGLAG